MLLLKFWSFGVNVFIENSKTRRLTWVIERDLSGLSAKQDPRVVEQEKRAPLPDIDNVKPASNIAEFKSAATVVALRAASCNNFRGLSLTWCGALLRTAHLYYDQLADNYLLSLGFHARAVLTWEVEPLTEDKNYFVIARKGLHESMPYERLQFSVLQDVAKPGEREMAFSAVPTALCFLASVSKGPFICCI